MEARRAYVLILTLEMLNRIVSSSFIDSIEEMMFLGLDWTIPLRLVCQLALTNGGIKPKIYDQFKRDFCQVLIFLIIKVYGTHHILTFQNLEKLNILKPLDSNLNCFPALTKKLALLTDYETSTENKNISYAYNGYAPISLRLIEAALEDHDSSQGKKEVLISWEPIKAITELLPGKTFEKSLIPESKMFKSASKIYLMKNLEILLILW